MNKRYSQWILLGIFALSLFGCDDIIIRPLVKAGRTDVVVKKDVPDIVALPTIKIEETRNINLQNGGNNNGGGVLRVETGNGGEDNRRQGKVAVVFKITSDYPGGVLVPKNILLNGVEADSEDLFRPGNYEMRIAKPGYKTIKEQITIPEGKTEWVIKRQMLAKPRQVNFDITDNKTGARIQPDEVRISGKVTTDGGMVQPGKHALSISKADYKPRTNDSFTLPVGEKPYILRRTLGKDVVPTVINWRTEGTYPQGEEIVVETVHLDGKEIEQGSKVKAGKHVIEFIDPRYEKLSKEILVPQNIPSYLVEAVLTPLPRAIELNIKYDVQPTPQLGQTTTRLVGKSGSAFEIKSGQKVNPGEYELQISKRGYFTLRATKRIFPGTTPYQISETLESKPVPLQADITFDIQPPQDLDPYVVTFIDQRGIRTRVSKGGSIKPGYYQYLVEKPGYKMLGEQKDISIEPSENPRRIQEKMIAQPRKLTFNFTYGQRIIKPEKVEINSQEAKYDQFYKPGGNFHMVATFRGYRTIKQNIQIVPGPGDQVIKVALNPK